MLNCLRNVSKYHAKKFTKNSKMKLGWTSAPNKGSLDVFVPVCTPTLKSHPVSLSSNYTITNIR